MPYRGSEGGRGTLTALGPTVEWTVTGRDLPSRVCTWKVGPQSASTSGTRWVYIRSLPSLLKRGWLFSSITNTTSAGFTPGRWSPAAAEIRQSRGLGGGFAPSCSQPLVQNRVWHWRIAVRRGTHYPTPPPSCIPPPLPPPDALRANHSSFPECQPLHQGFRDVRATRHVSPHARVGAISFDNPVLGHTICFPPPPPRARGGNFL